MKDYSTPAEGILKREADGTIASQEVTEVELVDLAAVATSGSYNDLNDKPTIPTVGDATITIKQGSTTKGSFTTNQSSGKTITLDANTDTLGKNIVGTSVTASANGEVSGTDGVYLNHIEGTNTVKSSHKIVGSGTTTVKSDANGNITINTDKPTFCVSIEEAQDGTLTVNKTPEEIYTVYTSGYAVCAIYKDQALELLLSLKLALPNTTEFSGIYGVTESTVGFITISNAGSRWAKQLTSVPIADKVVPTARTVNNKALSANITLNADDVNAVGLTGDQIIAGDKTFSDKATFDGEVNFSNSTAFNFGTTFGGGIVVNGGSKFTGQQSFNDGMVVGGSTQYKENSTVDFSNATVSGLSGLTPKVTTSDNGKFLRVVNGTWAPTTIPSANGGTF